MPRQNTNPSDYPHAVLQQIEQLAQNIAVARKRRGETQAQWAKKLGVSQPTFARIERGDPGVAMASYVMCMWLIDPAVGLADLVSPQSDQVALEREVSKATKKRRAAVTTGPAKVAGANPPAAQTQMVLRAREPQPVDFNEAARMALKSTTGQSKGNATAEGLAALLLKAQDKPT